MSKHKKHNKKKSMRKKRSWLIDTPVWVCVILFVLGLLLCTVFPYIVWYEGELIERDEAIPCSATLESYVKRHSPRGGGLNRVELRFTDHDSLDMDAAYFDADIQNKLDLYRGETVDMLLHPNSNNIWEMKCGDTVILAFEDAKSGILYDNIGMTVILGGFGCFVVIVMVISLCLKWKERKREREIRKWRRLC